MSADVPQWAIKRAETLRNAEYGRCGNLTPMTMALARYIAVHEEAPKPPPSLAAGVAAEVHERLAQASHIEGSRRAIAYHWAKKGIQEFRDALEARGLKIVEAGQ